MRSNKGSLLLEYATVIIPTIIFTVGMFDAFTAYQTLSAMGEAIQYTAREFARIDGESVHVTPDSRTRRVVWKKYTLNGPGINADMVVSATYTGLPLGQTPSNCLTLQPQEMCDFELEDTISGSIGTTTRSASTAIVGYGITDMLHSMPNADFAPSCTGAHCASLTAEERNDTTQNRRIVQVTATYNHPLRILGGTPVTFTRTIQRPLEEGFIDDNVRQSNPTCSYLLNAANPCT